MGNLYRFERCEIRPAERQLLIDGDPAALGARAVRSPRRAGRTARSRRRQVGAVRSRSGPDLVVEENNLQVQVSSLRKLLGPSTIATVPGRGYQFVARAFARRPPERSQPAPRANRPANPNNLPHAANALHRPRERRSTNCAATVTPTRASSPSPASAAAERRTSRSSSRGARMSERFPRGDLVRRPREPRRSGTGWRPRSRRRSPCPRRPRHAAARRPGAPPAGSTDAADPLGAQQLRAPGQRSGGHLAEGEAARKLRARSRRDQPGGVGIPGEQVFAVGSLSLPGTSESRRCGSRRRWAVRRHGPPGEPELELDERNAGGRRDLPAARRHRARARARRRARARSRDR